MSREKTFKIINKSARNECRKIRATYYNNTAVGMTVTTVIIPVLTAYQQYQRFIMSGHPPRDMQALAENNAYIIAIYVSVVLSALIAAFCKYKAEKVLEEIEE